MSQERIRNVLTIHATLKLNYPGLDSTFGHLTDEEIVEEGLGMYFEDNDEEDGKK